MTEAKINAIVASAYNLSACEEPSLRRVHPNGMTPAIAAALPKSVRLAWTKSYAERVNRYTPTQREEEGFLYGPMDAQAAIDALSQ